MEKNRPLKNALNDKTSSKKNRRKKPQNIEVMASKKSEDHSKEDIIDKFFRGLMALFSSAFTCGIIVGILEVPLNWEISAGSLPMIAITAFLYYPWYKILTVLGFFRQR